MSGDISQANEKFVSAEHYFKRGLLDKRNGQMHFTLGLLEYFKERFEAAVKFFDSAEKSRDADKTLRCNCELYKGECFLAQGDVRSASFKSPWPLSLFCLRRYFSRSSKYSSQPPFLA